MLNNVYSMSYAVLCRVGSLEISKCCKGVEFTVLCRVGSLENQRAEMESDRAFYAV